MNGDAGDEGDEELTRFVNIIVVVDENEHWRTGAS